MIRRVIAGLARRVPWLADPIRAGAGSLIDLARFSRLVFRQLRDMTRGDRKRAGVLRVAVDITPFHENLTGVGWYLHELLVELGKRDDVELYGYGSLWVHDAGPHFVAGLPEGVRPRVFRLGRAPIPRYGRQLAELAWLLLVALDRPDVTWGANFFLPKRMELIGKPEVLTIHDLTWKRYPELVQKETLEALEERMPRAVLRAAQIITVSESTRRDVVETWELTPAKVTTVLSGIRHDSEPRETTPPPRPYLLFVSTIEPRKDLDTLLTAFETLCDRGAFAGTLVVAGKVGWSSEKTVRRMRQSPWASRIEHLDYVPRDRLFELYANATVYVMPSLYEGFGLPILEAMSMGAPVVCSDVSSLPEVAGGAALLFRPGDAEDLAAKIDRVLNDEHLRDELISRGRQRVAQLTWSKSAAETLAVLQRAAD